MPTPLPQEAAAATKVRVATVLLVMPFCSLIAAAGLLLVWHTGGRSNDVLLWVAILLAVACVPEFGFVRFLRTRAQAEHARLRQFGAESVRVIGRVVRVRPTGSKVQYQTEVDVMVAYPRVDGGEATAAKTVFLTDDEMPAVGTDVMVFYHPRQTDQAGNAVVEFDLTGPE